MDLELARGCWGVVVVVERALQGVWIEKCRITAAFIIAGSCYINITIAAVMATIVSIVAFGRSY